MFISSAEGLEGQKGKKHEGKVGTREGTQVGGPWGEQESGRGCPGHRTSCLSHLPSMTQTAPSVPGRRSERCSLPLSSVVPQSVLLSLPAASALPSDHCISLIPIIHSFNKCSLNTYYVPRIFLDTEDTMVTGLILSGALRESLRR